MAEPDGAGAHDRAAGRGRERHALAQSLRRVLAEPRTPHFADRIAYADLRDARPRHEHARRQDEHGESVEARAPLQDYKLVELALRLPLTTSCAGRFQDDLQGRARHRDSVRNPQAPEVGL